MKKRIRSSLMPFAMRPDCNVIERKRRGKRVCQCQAKALASKQVPPANEPSPPLSSGLVNHITLIKCACCLVVVPPLFPRTSIVFLRCLRHLFFECHATGSLLAPDARMTQPTPTQTRYSQVNYPGVAPAACISAFGSLVCDAR